MKNVSTIHKVKKKVNEACVKLCKTKDDAEDLGQQIFLKLLTNYQNIEHPECFNKWVCNIIKNTYINEKRRGKRETPFSYLKDNRNLYHTNDDGICIKNYVLGLDDDSSRIYNRLTNVLKPIEKNIIEKTLVHGFRAKEVCENLNLTPNGLAKMKIRAIKKMKNEAKLSDLPPSWMS